MQLSRARTLTTVLSVALAAVACERCTEPGSPPLFPHALAKDVLDAEASAVPGLIERHYPGSVRRAGSLERYAIRGGGDLVEVVVFFDVRSGRVGSLVLKFRADLDDARRDSIARATGAPQLSSGLGPSERIEGTTPAGRHVRALRRDKRGQLSITLE